MRFIKICTLSVIIFSSEILSAQEIIVTNRNLKYILNNSPESISFKSHDVDLSIRRKVCNAHIVDRFNTQFNKLISKPFLDAGRPDFIEIKMNGSISFESKFSERGISLLQMYEKFKKIKFEETLSCP